MSGQLGMSLSGAGPIQSISPMHELGAYEALWLEPRASMKTIAEKFAANPGSLPSDFVPLQQAWECAGAVMRRCRESGVPSFGVRVHGAGEYPSKLRDAAHPVELLYYRGWWDLVSSVCVAVVGTRKPSDEGRARTRKIARALVRDNYTVVSGLAAGVDREAHEATLGENGRTIAVIGTPLNHRYPRENADLQEHIAKNFLVISQVPVLRYERQNPTVNRFFFPERNITMSALTAATIIVEAGETSGTLVQARAALHQGRKLFILDSCFRNPKLKWPQRYEEQGAIRVRDYDDIRRHLPDPSDQSR